MSTTTITTNLRFRGLLQTRSDVYHDQALWSINGGRIYCTYIHQLCATSYALHCERSYAPHGSKGKP